MVDVGYPSDPDDVMLLPGVSDALNACLQAGFRLAIISNQSGVGRGYFDADAVTAVHQRLLELLKAEGIGIDDAQYCLHAPEDGCACRKPSPLMLQRSAAKLGADLAASFMIGDKSSDVEAGHRAGCRGILLRADGGVDADGPWQAATTWPEVARLILDAPISQAWLRTE